MMSWWSALCIGWVAGLITGRVLRLYVMPFVRNRGARMRSFKLSSIRSWVDRNFLAIALIILALCAGMTAISIQMSNAARDDAARRALDVAICTGKYLAADAEARDARAEAVKPRDDAEAAFIEAVAALRDGSTPKKAAALFKATDDFKRASLKLDKVRAVDYPTYTCDD